MGDDENSTPDAGPRSEGNLELFFDLVFTFAMSQVTLLVLRDLSPTSFGRAALALLAVWWAWVGYTWLINTFDTANVWHEAVIIAAMAAMLVAAAALPTAFASGALVFAIGSAGGSVDPRGEVRRPILRTRTPRCGGAPGE